jgi:hypothetical protein
VSTTLYVEGGGSTEVTQARLRQGFAAYCRKVNPKARRLRIAAQGGREQACEEFKLAVANAKQNEIVALLVDSESQVAAGTCVDHLRTSDNWQFPAMGKNRVFLMVQCMESWFLADRDALAAFYDGGFSAKALPGSAANIEIIRKEDVTSGLQRATAKTKTKGEYHKVVHGSALLARINPEFVERASPHARQFHDFLRSL